MDVNSVIDNICNKIGTTADILIPELARYKEYSYLAGFIICFICIVISVSIIWIGNKLLKKGYDADDCIGFYLFGCTGLFSSLVVIMVQIRGYIVWHNAPIGAAVNYILNSL